ncbi:hypothetical protein A3Q34_18365 [Colwellia sp. PAMC 20917]|uniref:Ig-like domain-containing protein n=1 Tax=Colwellia sp. PAMC 20917 TaxID=1816218 RepID=UPI00087911A9|nr:putative Ig domain-containing protein [Colwellia sp. PAMC 20917]AOW78628.1 hypothetical protein A3Q34_18365 [Colwellia sp. PAMC 20917]
MFVPDDGGPQWHWKLVATNASDKLDFNAKPEAYGLRDIRYHRGAIIEQYIAKPQGMEQQFLITSPLDLNGQALQIEGEIEADGLFVETSHGWLWQNSNGVVSLGDVTVIDADGQHLSAYMEVTSNHTRIVVDAKDLATAAYPVLIDPEVGTNDFRISTMGPDGSAGYTADNPAVAYNSSLNEYLVVWEGDDDTVPLVDEEIEIFGQRINAETGALVGSRIRISEMGPDGDTTYRANTPTVAYSSAEDEYLVCWSGDDDSASKVNEEIEIHCNYVVAATGTTPFFPIIYSDMGTDGNTNYSAFNPDVTYNAINNEYLLVWEGSDNTGILVASEFEVYGQRILSTTGAEIGSNDFRISDMGNDGDADFDALRPAVSHNEINNEYLVVWGGENQGLVDEWEIYGQRIDGASGTAMGTNELGINDFRISDMGTDGSTLFSGFEPDIAFNRFNNEYLVVWEGEDNTGTLVSGEFEIFGQRLLGETAAETGTNDFRISDMGTDGNTSFETFGASVSYNKVNNEYLVVWSGEDNTGLLVDGEFEIYGQRLIASSGVEVGTNDFRISDMGTDGDADFDALNKAIAYNPENNEYLVVWEGENQILISEFEIYGQRIEINLGLVLNEIDYDQPGSDNNEFIELKNTGDAGIDLSVFSVELFNESSNSVYKTFTLPSVILAAGDYYVICGNSTRVSNCDQDDVTDIDLIQNGSPDAVALKWDTTIVDAVSYEGDSTAPYLENTGVGILDDPTMNSGGIGRIPDGNDTNDNATDWLFSCVTPGTDNLNVTTDCNVASVLTIAGANLSYEEGDGAVVIAALTTATDYDSAAFDSGDFTIDITSNGTANDRLSIINVGSGAGDIGFNSATGDVSYEGVVIGSASGGNNGSTPLVISFNTNSTIEAINVLATKITFENTFDNPSTLNRTVRFVLKDDDLDDSNAVTKIIEISNINDVPVNTVVPIISGTASIGNALSSTTGSWTDADGDTPSYSYQWYRADDNGGTNEAAIAGATTNSYTLNSADAHQYLRVIVTANDGNGSSDQTASSTRTAINNAAPVNTVVPVMSGTASIGNALSSTTGSWTDADGDSPSYSYQWYRADDNGGTNEAAIAGATTNSYTLNSADAHQYLRVIVTANDGNGSSDQTASSTRTAINNAAPVNTVVPVMSGTASIGNALSSTTGSWTDADGDTPSYSYQWYRADDNGGTNEAAIAGATTNSYTLNSADAHQYLRVIVTANDGNGSSDQTASSTRTAINNAAPVNTVVPVMSGTASIGNALSSTTGSWTDADGDTPSYSYQWYRADDNGGTNEAAIAGATTNSYTLNSADAHQYLRVIVTANDGNGSSDQTASSTRTAINNAAPVNTVVPVMSGTASIGNALSSTTGSWTDADGDSPSYSYQWYRADDNGGTNEAAIAGATTNSYTLNSADAHQYLRVIVTANDGNGSSDQTASSTRTAISNAAPVNTVVPVMSGTASIGNALSSTTGSWTDADGDSPSYSYQWYRADDNGGTNEAAIAGATTNSYTLNSADAHQYLRVIVTANDGNGSSDQTASSTRTAISNAAPVNTVVPVMSGTASIGNALSSTTGSWTDADGDTPSYSYQWYRADDNGGTNEAAIAGATTNSYTLNSADAHQYLRVIVTANDGNGSSDQTASSTRTAISNAAPVNTVVPVMSGTASIGNALSSTTGSWTDADGDSPSYSYQWYRADDNGGTNEAAIAGATTNSYTLNSADAHQYLRVIVTANDGNGSSDQTASSTRTAISNAAPVNTVVPVMSGTASIGNALSSTTGSWTDADGDTPSYSYQWYRADDNGGTNEAAIAGATTNSYTLNSADAHQYLRVIVTANDGNGSSDQTASSTRTAINNAAPVNTVVPVMSGTASIGNALSSTTGSWTDADGDSPSYSYQWYRADDNGGTNEAAIAGATTNSYTLNSADAHQYLRVIVTANDGNGSSDQTASSTRTAINNAAPVNTVVPVMSGTASIGNALSSTTGSWTDADGDSPSYSYQWYRADDNGGTNEAAIAGATTNSYTLNSADAHQYLRVIVTANDGNGSSDQTASSTRTAISNAAPVNTVVPVMSGTASIGNALSSTTGSWTDADGDTPSYSYQWYRADDNGGTNEAAIAGATTNSYTLNSADAHQYLRVIVTANDGNGSSDQTASSLYTLISNSLPFLSGTFTTDGVVNDNATITPFSGVTVADSDTDNVSINITYTSANGTLNGTGITGSAGNYTVTSALAATATSNLQVIIFTPTENQTVVGSTVVSSFTLIPNDGIGNGISNATSQLTATSINDEPTISGTPATSVTEDTNYSFLPTGVDIDSGESATLVYSITNKPGWASFDIATGALTGIPNDSGVGTTSGIVITVTDTHSAADSLASFDLTVTNINDDPVITGTATTSTVEDSLYNFTPSASDSDNGETASLVFSITNKPTWASFSTSSGALTGIPDDSDVGTTKGIVIKVTDINGAIDTLPSFDLVVTNFDDPPTVVNILPDITVNEDSSDTNINLNLAFADVDSDDTAITKLVQTNTNAALVTASITGNSLILSYLTDMNGSANITVRATSNGKTVDDTFTVIVTEKNDTPIFSSIEIAMVNEDFPYNYSITTDDVDGEPVSISASNIPNWLSLTDNSDGTAILSGTASNDEVGPHTISLKVSDGDLFSYQDFIITVSNVNDTPAINSAEISVATEDLTYSYTVIATDVDVGDSLIFSAPTLPSWLNFDSGTHTLTGMPFNGDVGIHNVVLRVTDASGASFDQNFSIEVFNANDTLFVDSAAIVNATEQVIYSYTLKSHDIDIGDSLTSNVITKPTWLSFTPITNVLSNGVIIDSGVLTGTPTNSDVGEHNVVLQITDGVIPEHQTFTINVGNINDIPVISGVPNSSVDEDALYYFKPLVTDQDLGDSQTFSITGKPDWASFNTSNGELTGTPGNTDVSVYNNIVITVTDAAFASDSLSAFNITVGNTNDAPIINSLASTSANEGELYSYTVIASDVDVGNSLTFNAPILPTWLSFDAGTQLLSGIPAQQDIGFYTVVLRVNDGNVNVDQSFVIEVSATNNSPVITSTAATIAIEDILYIYAATVVDPDDSNNGIDLNWSLTNAPAGMLISNLGVVTWTPANAVTTSGSVTLWVADGGENGSAAATESFIITVTNTNNAPTITGAPATSASEDSTYSFTPYADDVDVGDSLSFSIINQPIWAIFDTSTGALTGTPTNADVGVTNGIVITVTDLDSSSASLSSFDLSVINVNDAPIISGTPANSVAEDSLYSFIPAASDVDAGDSLSFSIINQPAWATFNPSNGALTGIPNNSDVSLSSGIVISVTDLSNASSSLASFNITVININDAPTISGMSATSVAEDSLYSFIPTASDADAGDSLSFSIINQPAWASFNPSNGALTGIPNNSDVGMNSGIVISVTDLSNASSSLASFNITVININDAPIISGTPANSVAEDSLYSFIPTASDADAGDSLSFSIINQPGWTTFNPSTGALTGTPGNVDVGVTNAIVITVTDLNNAAASLVNFDLSVINVNDAPTITGTPATSVAEDSLYSFTPAASDIDAGDVLTFSISNQPNWANFNTSTGALTGMPTNADVGVTNGIVITVTDLNNAAASLVNFDLSVINVNDAPTITGTPATSVAEDSLYSFTPAASDIDAGDVLTFSISNQPNWANFNTSTGALTGMPTNADVGVTNAIVITVTDLNNAAASLVNFDLSVINVNDAPTITGTPATSVAEDSLYSFTPAASDIDAGDVLTFSISNQPNWANFNTSTGALTGMPTNADVGVTNGIVITVTDLNNAAASLVNFDLSVINVNDAPTITGTPATSVAEDSLYSFTPAASDIDAGDVLTFSISNQPNWANFNTSTGALTGMPTNADVGVTNAIVITVTDLNNAAASLVSFDLSVINVNDAPTITGTPATSVAEDSLYSFTPAVSDIDAGDVLTFSISNQPIWANFNTSTGALTGMPTNADVGVTNGIVITVTDLNNVSSSLTGFDLTVINVNDTPEVIDQNITTNEDIAVSIVLIGTDVDGDSLSFMWVNEPSNGTLTGVLPNLSYTPNANFSGSDSFSFKANDGTTDSNTATVYLTINSTNDTPLVSDKTVTMLEDSSVDIILTASDSDNDKLTFVVVRQPSNGLLTGQAPDLLFTPNGNFNGSDSFTFKANDGELDSETKTVAIDITPVNDEPQAVDDYLSRDNWDTVTIDVLLNDSDVDADAMTIEGANVNSGTLSWTDELLTFTPNIGFKGVVVIDYTISDNQQGSDSAQVFIDINVDDVSLPVINAPADVEVNADALLVKVELGVATAVDQFGRSIAVTLVDDLTFFKPGIHSVIWRAMDSEGLVAEASQLVRINPLISLDKDQTMLEGGGVTVGIRLNGVSPQYPLHIPFIVTGSANSGDDHNLNSGVVVIESGTEAFIHFDILADVEIEGQETIVLELGNTVNRGSKFIHTVTINEDNVAPRVSLTLEQSGSAHAIIYQQAGEVVVNSKIDHPKPDRQFSYIWSNQEQIITDVDNIDESFSFDPSNLSPGLYHIQLKVTDLNEPEFSDVFELNFKLQTMAIDLGSDDFDGDGIPDNIEGHEDSDGDGLANYMDAFAECNVMPSQVDTSNFLVEGEPGVCLRLGDVALDNGANGLRIINEQITDTETVNMSSVFDFIAYNLPMAGESYQIVLPQVQPVPAKAIYRKLMPLIGWVTFSETQADQLWSTQGERGYCPPPGDISWQKGLVEGSWCVQLTIQDGGINDADGLSNNMIVDPGGVAVFINNNTPPVANDDMAETSINTSLIIDVLANDSDVDGDLLTISSANANLGQVIVVGSQLEYQPVMQFIGIDTIVYAITDGMGGATSASVSIEVLANQKPIANNDIATVKAGQQIIIDVLVNDSDGENDILQVIEVTAEQGSIFINADNTLTYTAPLDFIGVDSVNYLIRDEFGGEASGQIEITVTSGTIEMTLTTTGGGSIGLFFILLLLLITNIKYLSLLQDIRIRQINAQT